MPITAEALATLIREIEVEDPIDYGDLPYDEDDLRLLVCNHIREIAEQAAQLGEENRMTVLLAVAAKLVLENLVHQRQVDAGPRRLARGKQRGPAPAPQRKFLTGRLDRGQRSDETWPGTTLSDRSILE